MNKKHRRRTVEELHDVLSTTHHKLSTVAEEMRMSDLSATSATHRVLKPLEQLDVDSDEESKEAAPVATEEAAAEPNQPEPDISLRIHEKVASIASKAYRRASAKSSVLSMDKIRGIDLIKFDHIEVGQLLGKGSFSNVYEITKISSDESKKSDLQGVKYTPKENDEMNFLQANYQRRTSKTFRYAIKYLKDDILDNPNSYAVGTVDLVIEGMFLASLTHPNIIKVRALPEGGVESLLQPKAKGYFLVLDRLFDTLFERIYNLWQEEHRVDGADAGGSGCLCIFGKKNKKVTEQEKKYLGERLKVAFDISAALKFMHEKNIIYRDLKPENLGFDGELLSCMRFNCSLEKRYLSFSSCVEYSHHNIIYQSMTTYNSTWRHQAIRSRSRQRTQSQKDEKGWQLQTIHGRNSTLHGSRMW